MLKTLRRIRHIRTYLTILVVLAVAIVAFYLYSYRPNHSPTKIVTAGNPVAGINNAPTTSKPTAKSTNITTTSPRNAGGATDNSGKEIPSTSSSQWTTSASGVITVKAPAPNATLKVGDSIAGSAKVNQVQFRLSDNKVGVIAQGSLNVVNGSFSGTLHFTPKGTGGRLDVFSTDANGVEYNEVQINVSF